MKRTVLIQLIVALFVLTGCDTPDASTSEAAIAPVESQIAAPSSQEDAATGETVDEVAEESGEDANEVLVQEPAEEPTEEPMEESEAEEAEAQESGLPLAEITNDEGGPVRLIGGIDWTNFEVGLVTQDPSPALLDMVHVVEGDTSQFAPVESQILGYMTSPVNPPPIEYVFNLPQEPQATFIDVDNNGEDDQGVQIFRLVVAANVNGGSYLEQLDQWADLNSYLTDPLSGEITEGSLLIYAPDNLQGFPNGFGEDGLLLTADDPTVGLPQGYTVVHFDSDGFTFDRSREAELNVLENVAAVSPDFSDQGLLESYNTLIDFLSERYSFTEFRNLDWEAIRAEYRPAMEQAEALAETDPDQALGLYYYTLTLLATSIEDAHVQAVPPIESPAFVPWAILTFGPVGQNVGANTMPLDDGRIIVTDVLPDSPADMAGWTFGTEIISVDGVPVEERIPTVYYNSSTGTEQTRELLQVQNLLRFPAGTSEVLVEAILPGETDAQSFALVPAQLPLPDRLAPLNLRGSMPIEFDLESGVGYLSWDRFLAPEVYMAVFEEFLREVNANPEISGIILDMRGNGGGWDRLSFTMASYFFNEENPVSINWIDQDVYDPETGEFVREVAADYQISSPDPELYYDGPLVILTDNNCASSCEFFSQFLQTSGRATVISQSVTKGAGAPIDRVTLPGDGTFQYTKGRAYFAGTDQFNIEAVGVTPDVRVPISEETELLKIEGGDPVLQAAVDMLSDMAVQESDDEGVDDS